MKQPEDNRTRELPLAAFTEAELNELYMGLYARMDELRDLHEANPLDPEWPEKLEVTEAALRKLEGML